MQRVDKLSYPMTSPINSVSTWNSTRSPSAMALCAESNRFCSTDCCEIMWAISASCSILFKMSVLAKRIFVWFPALIRNSASAGPLPRMSTHWVVRKVKGCEGLRRKSERGRERKREEEREMVCCECCECWKRVRESERAREREWTTRILK